jgi:uncharacterized protein
MGKVEHFEIPADDVAKAKAFYGAVFKWSFEDWPGGAVAIKSAAAEGETGVIGGDIYLRKEPAQPTVVVTVDDIEETLAAITEGGGKPLGKIEHFGDQGRYTYFEDPQGNRIGLWDTKTAT